MSETMKGPVLSAWLAAGLLLVASAARAQQADCDLICHLQGYLSTDHMAAPAAGATSPSAGAAAKRRPRTAAKTPKTDPKTAVRPTPVVAAKPPVAAPVRAAAKPPANPVASAAPATVTKPEASRTAAVARSASARGLKVPSSAPHPGGPDAAIAALPKPHLVAAAVSPPDAAAPGVAPTAPPRMRPVPHRVPRFARATAPRPIASATLIPGSARLVPAEFQTFGNL